MLINRVNWKSQVYYIGNLARGGREQVHMEKLGLDS